MRHGKARERVHDEQHVQALVAEMFGQARGIGRALQAQQRRDVGRRGDHHRAGQAFGAEVVLDEFLDFAAPFADQAHHDDVGAGVARHHAQQHALAHPRPGEQAHALTPADGQQAVDGAHAHVEHAVDGRARQGVDGQGGQGRLFGAGQRTQAVERPARAVDDACR
ncbi:Uncharacterised protein [Bordetella pertussis]|nr:Uncharacterised protein [Bordetella pertussis]